MYIAKRYPVVKCKYLAQCRDDVVKLHGLSYARGELIVPLGLNVCESL